MVLKLGFLIVSLVFIHVVGEPALYGDDEFDDIAEVMDTTEKHDELLVHDVDEGLEPTDAKPNLYVEIIGLLILFIYGMVFFFGRRLNETIARACFQDFGDLFVEQFSATGLAPDGDTSKRNVVIKESQSNYKFFCTGRRYCKGLIADVDLVKRQDLISMISRLAFPTHDILNIDIALNSDGIEKFVFCLGTASEFSRLQETNPELAFARKSSDLSGMPTNLNIYTEFPEITQVLLTKLVQKTLFSLGSMVESILVTDMQSTQIDGFEASCKHFMRCRFIIPSVQDLADMQRLLEMTLYFVDVIGNHTLSKEARKRSDQTRKSYREKQNNMLKETQQEKAERARLEKQKKERDEYSSLTYEQQQKRDAILEKKKARKRLNKLKSKH